ncbi:DUF3078 domain-containing protein [Marivirga sp. S37H4]|uniref:DUF3078 domain-containing protein n=1 Tax=Marivirga aurantiaca TaxID=2802615 RepID=A0A935C616_9BACT|nr:DUF3078 domain-containing protein [Marivirga aurantiaca]MBK6263472.1 DUF3078 domain-containing protein [Marivirga aurantiaca]
MKIFISIISIFFVAFNTSAQNDSTIVVNTIPVDSISTDTTYWNKGAQLNINFSQVSLTNWSGGGKSSISIGALTNFKANYQKNKDVWDNRLDLAYGVLRQGEEDQPFVKTDDNIIFTTKYSRKIKNNMFVSGLVDFRTQFYKGVDTIEDEEVVISRFMAPGFLLANIGVTYRYKKMFSATFSPLSSKTTFVQDDSLSAAGSYGVEPGETYRFQGGLNFTSSLETKVMENIDFTTNLNLFSAYGELTEIDVNWETAFTFKINKFFTSSFSTQLIYDEDIKSKEIVVNEVTGESRLAPGVQFKSVINIGLAFSF